MQLTLKTACLWACSLILGLLLFSVSGRAALAAEVSDAKQLVLVLSDSFDSSSARLVLFEREGVEHWKQAGKPIGVLVGRNGLAWGLGLHNPQEGPQKREGDGKAPAGIFELGTGFGSQIKTPQTGLDYFTTTGFECVDDENSSYYNQIVDAQAMFFKPWKSSEEMARPDGQYDLGVFVLHNPQPAVRGAGSCIFLHIEAEPAAATSGCTAMERSDLVRILAWLDKSKNPLLVQMPEAEYARLKGSYGMP